MSSVRHASSPAGSKDNADEPCIKCKLGRSLPFAVACIVVSLQLTSTLVERGWQSVLWQSIRSQNSVANEFPRDHRNVASSTSLLPTCRALMRAPDSPFRDGAFLTRHTIPVSWHPRKDGSRELQHSVCQLHRYTADQAKQCLKGQHVNVIGDSFSRYLYVSLVWFLHHGSYPPRFARPNFGLDNCTNVDETGKEQCSPKDSPNICQEGDWIPLGGWRYYVQAIGSQDNKTFGGFMESSAIRDVEMQTEQTTENYFYVSPPPSSSSSKPDLHPPVNNGIRQDIGDRVVLSYLTETGFHFARPIKGFNLTGCAYTGTCTYPDSLVQSRRERGMNESFDFSQPLEEAINASGALYKQLPPANIVIYNRGIWGSLYKERAEILMPLFYQWAGADQGRCFFRSTTSDLDNLIPHERTVIRQIAFMAGCDYLDFGHLVKDFESLNYAHPIPPQSARGKTMHERGHVYWDFVHFVPWVYEELNNIMLNVLCNFKDIGLGD